MTLTPHRGVSPVVVEWLHPPFVMPWSGSETFYHHMHYERDHYHWSHIKRELQYTPRNPPSQFLCLELLRFSLWHLHPKRSLPPHSRCSELKPMFLCLSSQAVVTPQLGAYAIALLFILACIGKIFVIVFNKSTRDFLLYNPNIIYALIFI